MGFLDFFSDFSYVQEAHFYRVEIHALSTIILFVPLCLCMIEMIHHRKKYLGYIWKKDKVSIKESFLKY